MVPIKGSFLSSCKSVNGILLRDFLRIRKLQGVDQTSQNIRNSCDSHW